MKIKNLQKIKIIKKKKEIKEKRYIVDNIDNIFSKLSEPKLKLIFQEYLLYGIVFLITTYFWIFLFLTTTKFEQNYCYTSLDQLDACSPEEICNDADTKVNIILYNNTFNLHNDSFKSYHDLSVEENRLINEYYRPFFLRYSELLKKEKIFTKIQMTSISDKTNFGIFLTEKEEWNIFLKYFSFCNYENYLIMILIMIVLGTINGSILFGILSDIFGRRTIIRIALFISTISTMAIFGICTFLDIKYRTILKFFQENHIIKGEDYSYNNIISNLFAQKEINKLFKKYFIFIIMALFLLSTTLLALLKSCLALLVENLKGDLEVLICFRKYNLVFGGLPPLFTSLILTNINNFGITFLILSIFNLIAFIYSCFFFEESIRYYYEFCEWKELTQTILNTYKNDIKDFKNLSEFELKNFKKEENIKNFNYTARKMNSHIKTDINGNTIIFIRSTYYNDIIEKNIALNRNLKRNTDFIIKLEDVKTNPFLIITSLFANRSFKKSKMLIIIIIILLHIVLHLFQKELLEPPYFTIKDFYIDTHCNLIINSILFVYLIINFLSNYFYYAFYRINCFNTIIVFSLFFIAISCAIYQSANSKAKDTLIDLNQYNFHMLTYYNRDSRSPILLILIFMIYFALNGVNFYIYLLILKISKTIYRCTYFSLHSLSLIFSMVISEIIYYYMEDYFLFLGSLILICLLTFAFLGDFKELLNIMNDLKIDIYRPSKNKQEKEKIN